MVFFPGNWNRQGEYTQLHTGECIPFSRITWSPLTSNLHNVLESLDSRLFKQMFVLLLKPISFYCSAPQGDVGRLLYQIPLIHNTPMSWNYSILLSKEIRRSDVSASLGMGKFVLAQNNCSRSIAFESSWQKYELQSSAGIVREGFLLLIKKKFPYYSLFFLYE